MELKLLGKLFILISNTNLMSISFSDRVYEITYWRNSVDTNAPSLKSLVLNNVQSNHLFHDTKYDDITANCA